MNRTILAIALAGLSACNLNLADRSGTRMAAHTTPDGRLQFDAPSDWIVDGNTKTETFVEVIWSDGQGGNYAALSVSAHAHGRLAALERSTTKRLTKDGYRLVLQREVETRAGTARHLRFHGTNPRGTEHDIDCLFLTADETGYFVHLVTNDTSNESRDAILRSFRPAAQG
ncbi:MAG: hypothetical protein HYY17_02585 [Planctomycetes bacterium]|nr:hypothetical protein [Planctomycetota bacterium]